MSIYWRLIRPGLLLTVLFSMAVAALVVPQPPPWPRLVHALFGTALVIAGASAMNQLLEKRQDATMTRTASRPLPSGQATGRQAGIFAMLCSLAGIVDLALFQPLVVTLLAASSWAVYVLIYTPLKRVSVWQTPVGALAGATPVLLGAATADAIFAPLSLVLFGIVFFWQFPHTASIGWIYRQEYARAEVMVAAVVDPSGKLSGKLAVFGASCLLPISLIPTMLSITGWPYGLIALSLGVADLAVAARFLVKPDDATARALRRVSLVHLPVLLIALLLAVRCF